MFLCSYIGLFLFFLTLLFQFSIISAGAHESGNYEVGATSLNVRSSPTMNAEVIGSYPNGEIIHVKDIKYGWAKVSYEGVTGWVASQYLFKTGSSGSQHTSQVTVGVDVANIRTGPSTDYKVITQATDEDVFPKLGESNGWVKIQLENGKHGWIAGWLVYASREKEQISERPLEGINIVLDAGHGGFDPGAIAVDGTPEKVFTLPTTERIAESMRNAGATVILTREKDRYLALEERVRISEAYYTHAFISVHYNASYYPSARGISTYYYQEPKGRNLASDIQARLNSTTSLQNDGIRHGNFHVLRENIGDAVLVELGFISNPHELKVVKSSDYQQSVAKAITQGVINHFSN
ncbi:N-acetylmuramoyl-L-alanine amidase [Thalassobacillus cyri]|nr:N-acetylmuramoyl-L-alanine amidase [Thalassobacillus cyri]